MYSFNTFPLNYNTFEGTERVREREREREGSERKRYVCERGGNREKARKREEVENQV